MDNRLHRICLCHQHCNDLSPKWSCHQTDLNKSDPLSLSKIDSERADRHHNTNTEVCKSVIVHPSVSNGPALSSEPFDLCVVASAVLLLPRLSRIYQPLVVLLVWAAVSFSPTAPYPRTWKSSSNHNAPTTELGSISKCSPCTLLSFYLFSCWTPWITHSSCTPEQTFYFIFSPLFLNVNLNVRKHLPNLLYLCLYLCIHLLKSP